MKNINVCFPIAKELLQPLGLHGSTKRDAKILQAALVYVCKNGTANEKEFADDFKTIMCADFNNERKQYYMSVQQESWIKLNEISRETGFPMCRLIAWGVFCVQHLQTELSAIGAQKRAKAHKNAVIDMLHKDLQRIIDDLLINDNELWIVTNREMRSRLLILVDMADYVYDLVKKEIEKGEQND